MCMDRNFMELFKNKSNEKNPEARKLDSTLRETTSKLQRYLKKSDSELEILYTLGGNMYLPDISPSFCSICITNANENRKEEIFSSRNAKFIGYTIGKTDGSIKAMEYNFREHPGIVAENFNRILNDVNGYLDDDISIVI